MTTVKLTFTILECTIKSADNYKYLLNVWSFRYFDVFFIFRRFDGQSDEIWTAIGAFVHRPINFFIALIRHFLLLLWELSIETRVDLPPSTLHSSTKHSISKWDIQRSPSSRNTIWRFFCQRLGVASVACKIWILTDNIIK